MGEKDKEVNNSISKNESDDYEFVTETIKRKPFNVKKFFKKLFLTLFLGIIFGIVACVVFVLFYPKIKDKLDPDDGTVAVFLPIENETEDVEEIIPETKVSETKVAPGDISQSDKEPGEEELTDDSESDTFGDREDLNPDNTDAATDKSNEKAENPEEKPESDTDLENDGTGDGKDETSNVSEDDADNAEGDAEENDSSNTTDNDSSADSVIPSINFSEEQAKKLELDDYRLLLRKISTVAENTQKSLVTVSGFYSDTDWFNNSYESNNSTIGLIVADNGKELLIVSSTNIFKNAINVKVTFVNGQTYPAKVKKSDRNTGLCVVGVELAKISEETMSTVVKAEFGGLTTSAVGVPVIAVGAPYGTSGSYGMGQITSNSMIIDKTDTNVGIISTNIYGSTTASGVLVNYNGRIVGIICHEAMAGDMPNLLRAYTVTDISDTIEKLSNGQELAKLGIIGTDVTEDANERLEVPFGTYIKEVVPDSPAMNVGLRNGDVIVKIGTTEITSFSEFKEAMLKCHPMDVVVVTVMRPGMKEYTEVTYEITLEAL